MARVKNLLIASTAVVAAAAGVSAYVAISEPAQRVAVVAAASDGVPGQYIVTMKRAGTHLTRISSLPMRRRFDDGFAAKLSPDQLRKVQQDPNEAAIEQDTVIKADTVQNGPVWGLDRIDQRKLPRSTTYSYTHTGADVDAYVIDSGIDTGLAQFGGRADTAYGNADCNGHGTHVAGIIGSRSYGVAKAVRLHAVQVLDCEGSGATSDVIAGINWVTAHHAARSVANLSLGGAKSTALNNAVTKLSKSGVFVSVSAGNDNTDACTRSPASAASVEAVAASASNDTRASFSNYGACVDIYAPGVYIKSTYLGGTAIMDGTSMSSPFVTGVAALYKSTYGQASFGTVQKWLHAQATPNVIKNNKAGTKNRLLYKSSL